MTTPGAEFSEWIVYVDESGDHGIASIDPTYPVFVLVFVIFKKPAYINQFVPPLSSLKFRLFGHDGVVLHERDIRKDLGAFRVLRSAERKELFMEEITEIIRHATFDVLATVHDKRRLAPSTTIGSLYHEAMRFGLEQLHERLHVGATGQGVTHVVCESRGKREDAELREAFEKACGGHNRHGCALPFEIVVTDKQANSAGLQLADLVARPIGVHHLRPEQTNRAFQLVTEKLLDGPAGEKGWGLRAFP